MRMFKHMGVKYIGRAAAVWTDGFADDNYYYDMCKKMAAKAHETDPEFLLQACVFEAIKKSFVDNIPIPSDVFEAFGLPVEDRCFQYNSMIFADGRYVNHWSGSDSSVPDITRIETRLWFYYRATRFIEAGYEGIHFGQVCLIGRDDTDMKHWRQVIGLTREYAAKHARRHYVVIDAHQLREWRRVGQEMFDFNAFPIRLKETPDKPLACICEEGYLDSMFNEQDGFCKPFLVEFDNFGILPEHGQPTIDSHYAWGYDEITWFAIQDKSYRHEFLRYITDWVNSRYPDGWVQFPSRRVIRIPASFIWKKPDEAWLRNAKTLEGINWEKLADGSVKITRNYYSANNPTDVCPIGFGDEDVIAELICAQNK
jgi:hypothetical protein